jgi:tetratricopeptide (TPR) repeat protein
MNRWDRVTELFERALALDTAERALFLDRQCGEDAALRSEIDSLLDSYSAAPAFFDDLGSGVVGRSIGGLFGSPLPIAPGTALGAYEVEAPIGGGGMGIVYRARDRRLDRTVALKFIAPELTDDPAARERLIREARAAAALDDPRIAGIYAIEEAPDGRLFLVMPYYTGQTLKQRLAGGRLESDEAVAIMIEVAEGLARAHRAGIVHRDVKPANVMITEDGAVKVLDFGVARRMKGTGPTRSGATLGTAAYMAPERVRGEPADPRSDVWSLGVVLYEMLAGVRPFQADSEPALLYAVLESSPVPLRSHAPGLPAALEQLVEQMLSKDAALRPADAGAVAEALRNPASPAPRLRPALPRSAVRRVGMAAALAGLIGLALVATRMKSSPAGPPTAAPAAIAVLPFVIRGDPGLDYLRDGMVHLLSTKLDGLGNLRAVDPHALLATLGPARDAPDPAAGRDAAARFAAQGFVLGTIVRLGQGIELSASIYGADGALRATATAMAKEEAGLSDAVDELVRALVAHRLADDGAPLAGLAAMTTRSLPALRSYLEGEHFLRTGRPAAALAALQAAVEFDSTFGLAWYRLARAAGWIGPAELNESAAERAVRFGGGLPERTRTLIAGYRSYRMGDPLEAERAFRGILARYPEDMEALELLGETLFHNNPFLGRPAAEAREPLEHALEMDVGNRELMVHLMDLAAVEGRTADLDSLTARYVTVVPGDELPTALHAYAALRDIVREPPARWGKILSRLAAAGPGAVSDALVRVAPQLRDPGLSDRLAAMLADPSNDAPMRASGHLHRAWLAAGRGRWSAAESHWNDAGSLQPDWRLVQRVLAAAVPHSPLSPAGLDSMRAAVSRWTPPAALEDGLHEGDTAVLRTYLAGLLAWRAGDDSRLARAVAELAAPSQSGVLAPALAATLEALEHWRSDRLADAMAALDRAELRLPFHRRARSPVLEQHLNRFVRGEILRAQAADGRENAGEAGQAALRWYASLEDGYFHWGAPFVGPALLGAAEIHEREGRTAEAAAAYERFLVLWADADPELHTWLDLAHDQLARLRPTAP